MSGAREELESLLPAYVNGQLGPEDAARVEQALAEDAALAEELRFVQALRAGVHQAVEDTAAPPGELGWYRLRRSIGREAAPRRRVALPWRPALAAAAVLVITVQAGLLWQAYRPGTGAYEPLSSDAAGAVQVRWTGDAGAAEIERLLRAHDLEIIAGPSASGVYRLAPTGTDEFDVDTLVRKLRERDGVVAFAAAQ